MIPKSIFTLWINDTKPLPDLYKRCIDTQKLEGYTHHIITLDNMDDRSQYVKDAVRAGKWVKAADYLRVQYLVDHGGIHLDADMEVLPGKNFDDLLDNDMFTSRECTGLLAQAGFGAVVGHPYLIDYLHVVETNFRGDGEMVFEPGIRAFDDLLWYWRREGREPSMRLLPTEVFFPYNHTNNTMNVTPDTRVIHHYSKSWIPGESKI